MALFIKIDIPAYKEKISSQRRVLKHSLQFSEAEKALVNLCYDELDEICDKALEFKDAVNFLHNIYLDNK